MRNKFSQNYLIWILVLLLFCSLVMLGYLTILTDLNEFGSLRVNFLDVGQGDSILIQTPNKKQILIDGGPDKSLVFKLDKYIPIFKRKIDYIILTHPDKDHLMGLVEVLKRYKVNKVFINGDKNKIPAFKRLKEIGKKKGVEFKIVNEFYNLKLGKNLNLKFLWPIQAFNNYSKDKNFYSIVSLLDYKSHEFLLMGDADKRAENFIKDIYKNIKADVLKAGHHGSKSSSGINFLKRVNPEFFVISVGENNFGHPNPRVLDNSKKVEAKILQTKILGDIIFFTKDNKLFLKSN